MQKYVFEEVQKCFGIGEVRHLEIFKIFDIDHFRKHVLIVSEFLSTEIKKLFSAIFLEFFPGI